MLSRGKKQHKQRQKGMTAEGTRGNERVITKPVLALQGLAAAPRSQLLALSLLALELQVAGLPKQLGRY